MTMKEYKYVEVKFEAKGVLFHSASEPKEIINKYARHLRSDRRYQFLHFQEYPVSKPMQSVHLHIPVPYCHH